MSRHTQKATLRKLSEIAIKAVLKSVPRSFRRSVGRVYANAAYRELNGLGSVSYNESRIVHSGVLGWITKTFKAEQTKAEEARRLIVTDTKTEAGIEQAGLQHPR